MVAVWAGLLGRAVQCTLMARTAGVWSESMRDLLVRTGIAVLLGMLAPVADTAWGQNAAQPVQKASAQNDPAQNAPEQRAPADLMLEQLELQRDRIEALERRVSELTTERRNIASSLRQIEGMLANLRQELDTDSSPMPLIRRAETPSDALASPDSLLRELRSRYRTEMGAVVLDSDENLAAFTQKAVRWARLTNRELRGKRSWLVELEDLASVGQNGYVVRMTVLDESSGLPIGEAVDVGFPAKFIERYNRGSRSGRWVLTSIVIAKPVFNESRITSGVFEFPPYVGPMMEFDFELDWFSLSAWQPGDPVTPPEPVEEAPAAEPAADQPSEDA